MIVILRIFDALGNAPRRRKSPWGRWMKSTRLGRCGRTNGAACGFENRVFAKIAHESRVLIKSILAAVAPPQKPHWTLVVFDMSQLRLMWFADCVRRTQNIP
jgi:hypothetical protein